MQLRLGKKRPEEVGRHRQVVTQNERRPAFSYHTNQVLDRGDDATPGRKRPLDGVTVRLKARSIFSQFPFWLVVVLAILCLGKLLLLGTVPKVVVIGQTAVSSAYVQSTQTYSAAAQKLLSKSLANRTKLSLDSAGIAKSMQQQFPELQTVSVTVPLLGNRPIVYVALADPSLILRTTSGNFALNDEGTVLAGLTAVPAGITTLDDQSGVLPAIGKQVLPASTVAFIKIVTYQLAAAKLPILSVSLPKASAYELDVQLAGKGFMVRFNLLDDAKQQSGAVVAALTSLGSNVPSTYLDARVPGRIYYK